MQRNKGRNVISVEIKTRKNVFQVVIFSDSDKCLVIVMVSDKNNEK